METEKPNLLKRSLQGLRNFYGKHPILSIGIGVFVLISLITNSTNSSDANENQTPSVSAQPATSQSVEATSTSITSAPSATATNDSATPNPVTNTANVAVPATPTEQAPPATPAATWHTAYTYSNDTEIQTPPFTLQGSEWRITYTCTPASDNPSWTEFAGEIDSVSDGSTANAFANTDNCPTSQTSYAYGEQPGQYSLNVGGNTVSYTVTVEDYY